MWIHDPPFVTPFMITSAAIRLASGLVLTLPAPLRHANIVQRAIVEGLEQMESISHHVTFGFLDSDGEFFDRTQALVIAAHYGQLLSSANPSATQLNTEMLW